MNATSSEDMKQIINSRLEELLVRGKNGFIQPYVCLICDKLLKPGSVQKLNIDILRTNAHILKNGGFASVSSSLAECYKYNNTDWSRTALANENLEFIQHMLLSPRACYITNPNTNISDGFSVCGSCKYGLERSQMPKFAIANNWCVGTPPKCITDLTAQEIATLTPVKTHGYCFTYTGGKQKQLKGTLSYYKVRIESIARQISHFDVLGLNKDIVVVLSGYMTAQQRTAAKLKNKIRTDHVLKAMQWLNENNSEWKERNIDFDAIRRELRNPILIDNSRAAEESEDVQNSNVESTEAFEVYFPDGSISNLTGGQENIEEFRELLRQSKQNGFDPAIKCDLSREACADYKDNNLVNACLLQFPYGSGGMHETRMKGDGSSTDKILADEYIGHLSLLSQPHFHEELFSLILYNISIKQHMLRTASWKARNTVDAKALATELTSEDVEQAINARQTGSHINSASARTYLSSIDTIARSVPHTNQAAKRARRDGEAFQHNLGLQSLFLTIAVDDDNSFLLQVYSGVVIDDDTPISTMSDFQLMERAKDRTTLRIKYPGITAFCFDIVIDIIIRDVIGWDLDKQCPTSKPGLFGVPEGFIASVEEQGRGTLHTHIQIWIKEYNKVRDQLYSPIRTIRRNAKRKIVSFVDDVSSCALFDEDRCPSDRGAFRAFPHDNCSVQNESSRKKPRVVEDQDLRHLRYNAPPTGEMFAVCEDCTQSWTNEEFVASYLINGARIAGLNAFPEKHTRRLKAMAVEFQKSDPGTSIDSLIIDATYNHHSHTKSCFKRAASTVAIGNETMTRKKRKTEALCECRYRLPRSAKLFTTFQNATANPVQWYSWNGTHEDRHIMEIYQKRHEYDVFQNVCCPAISHSKLTCNTNISPVIPGPLGQYSFKYTLKGTQEDDNAEYERVSRMTRKALSKEITTGTAISAYSEAMRLLLSGSFAHQNNNVCRASMAQWLIRNNSRFIFSHDTAWCPLRDIDELLLGRGTQAVIMFSGNTPFFQNSALHYLCRPRTLENTTVKEFYTKYEIVRRTAKNEDELMSFVNTQEFQHPSYQAKKDNFMQGVQKRKREKFAKIYQYDFPDTAELQGNICLSTVPITPYTEKYAKQILLLFLPYRSITDIKLQNSYTLMLRHVLTDSLLKEEAFTFLQNIQDARSNSFRVSRLEDDLQRRTDPIKASDVRNPDSEEDEPPMTLQNAELDNLLALFDQEVYGSTDSTGSVTIHGLPLSVNLKCIKNKGAHRCGYDSLAAMNPRTAANESIYEVAAPTLAGLPQMNDVPNENPDGSGPKRTEIISILMTKTERRGRTFEKITKNTKVVNVCDANGSAESIMSWSEKAFRSDRRQRRAFEILASSFVLTFFDGAEEDTLRGRGHRTRTLAFMTEKQRLNRLAQKHMRTNRRDQLICFLHGPGGCGKTTLIDLVIEYAREYCSFMTLYQFTPRSIVVTAMSGVAATHLNGETTHRAVYLNQKKDIELEQCELWADTRLLIIDEISFASKLQFTQLDRNLRALKQRRHLSYGGLNIVFSGDMRQLEPVNKHEKPVYKEDCPEFQQWINCYIELQGMHRFAKDPEWGLLLGRFRDGTVTLADIDSLNAENQVNSDTILPDDIRYACFQNRDRDSINTALFEKRCESIFQRDGAVPDTMMILSDEVRAQNGSGVYVPFKNPTRLWESCGEDDARTPSRAPRMDPVLRLYIGCRVMLTYNKCVPRGEANGTQAIVMKVVLKPGVTPQMIEIKTGDSRIPIAAVKAGEVAYVVVKHCSDRIQPQLFHLQTLQHKFIAKIPKPAILQVHGYDREPMKMSATQIPLIINNATTGHKLQGSGVDTLFVSSWSYMANWAYVMLSRVTTRAGLFCRKPLSRDLLKYAVHESLRTMLIHFGDSQPEYWEHENGDDDQHDFVMEPRF